MKQVLSKRYKALIILVILILAAACLTMTACSSSSATNNEINARQSFFDAVDKIPAAQKLEYNHRSLLEDAKKKYNALTEKDGVNQSETLEDAKKRYDGLTAEEQANAKMLNAEIAYKTALEKFNKDFIVIESLVALGKGLLGIFLVMGIIVGVVYLLNFIRRKKDGVKEKLEQ